MKLTKRDLSDLIDLLTITQDCLDRERKAMAPGYAAQVNQRDRKAAERLIKKLKAEMKA